MIRAISHLVDCMGALLVIRKRLLQLKDVGVVCSFEPASESDHGYQNNRGVGVFAQTTSNCPSESKRARAIRLSHHINGIQKIRCCSTMWDVKVVSYGMAEEKFKNAQ